MTCSRRSYLLPPQKTAVENDKRKKTTLSSDPSSSLVNIVTASNSYTIYIQHVCIHKHHKSRSRSNSIRSEKKSSIHRELLIELTHSGESQRRKMVGLPYKQLLLGFVETSREVHRIFLKNGRLMALIAAVSTLLYSILYLANFLSLRPLVNDFLVKLSLLLMTSPTSTEFANLSIGLLHDIRWLSGVEWVFILAYFAASVLFSAATILASALSHAGQDNLVAGPRDVARATARCWKRLLVTYLYVSIFGLGCISLLLAILLPLMLSSGPAITAITLCASLLYAYPAVVWTLGTVVSALEEKSGMEALGKAGQLVKGGLVLKGLCLSVAVTLLSFGVTQIQRLATGNVRSQYTYLLIGMVEVNGLWLVRMYELMAFTVLYYEGKRNHKEETEMVLDMDYTKIPSLPLVAENLP